MISSSPARTQVFISYSHKDDSALKELKRFLAVYVNMDQMSIWDDTTILAGANWEKEIVQAIQSATVAILLLSADFFDSKFIMKHELPPLLQAAALDEITIIPVILSPCNFTRSPLKDFQAAHPPEQTRSSLENEHQVAQWWEYVTGHIGLTIKARQQKDALRLAQSPHNIDTSQLNLASAPLTPKQQDAIAEKYRAALLHDAHVTDVQVLDMDRPFALDRVYVKVHLHQGSKSNFELDGEVRKARDARTELRWRTQQLARRSSAALDPATAIRSLKRCVIVGDPGAGKTTLLKHLTLQSLQGNLPALPAIPLYIPLNSFASATSNDLLSFIAQMWEEQYHIPHADALAFIEACMLQGQILLLLDALDETVIGDDVESADRNYKCVVESISRLSTQYHQLPIVVTARKAGYHQRTRLIGFNELELLDFGPSEIKQFVDHWYAAQNKNMASADRFYQRLVAEPRIQMLAANPLLLTLIMLTFKDRQDDLPDRRAILYEECMNMLFQTWDKTRDVSRRRVFQRHHKEELLQMVAWCFHVQRLRYFAKKDLLQLIENYLRIAGQPTSQKELLLQEVVTEHGLLKEQGQGLYGFLHLTLQEFLAAQYVVAQHDLASLLSHLGDPWWEEVILLYAGSTPDASPLLQYLLGQSSTLNPPEDIFSTYLILAGRCLTARPRLRQATLRTEIPERLFSLLLDHRAYTLPRQHAADTLAELGSIEADDPINHRLLAYLISDQQDTQLRTFIAYALGEHGARSLVEPLLRFFISLTTYSLTAYFELLSNVIEAVAKLGTDLLIPTLVALIFNKQSNPIIAIYASHIISRIGNQETARLLLPALRDPNLYGDLRASLVFTVTFLGDEKVVSDVFELLADPRVDRDTLVENVLYALEDLANPSLLPLLLPLLSRKHLSINSRKRVAALVSKLSDETMLAQLASIIVDPQIEAVVRSQLAYALTRSISYCKQLIDLLLSEQTPSSIRMHIALGFAKCKDYTLIPVLRQIYSQGSADADVSCAVVVALGMLGDTTIFPVLENLLPTFHFPRSLTEEVAEAIAQYGDQNTLMRTLHDSRVGDSIRIHIVTQLSDIGTAAAVPALRSVVVTPHIVKELRGEAVKALGILANDEQTVHTLIRLLPASDFQDTLFQSLWAICSRADLTIIKSGPLGSILQVVKRTL